MRFVAILAALIATAPRLAAAQETGLVRHWKLERDGADATATAPARGAVNRGVAFEPGGPPGAGSSARFDGKGAHLEVPASPDLKPGTGDFSLALWVRTDPEIDGDPGDLISLFDAEKRVGFHLAVRTNSGVTGSQANVRQLQFAIDAGTEPAWDDVGRPGDAVLAFALAVHDGRLYAGTCGNQPGYVGRVYRYEGPTRWTDLGTPDRSNAVSALAEHDGALYAGTSRYRFRGSALPESPNAELGGGVYRLGGDGKWTLVGRLPGIEAVGGLVVYRGRLHASSMYAPAGLFRLEQDGKWTALPVPDGKRVVSLALHDGAIYAGSYDGGRVYRYDGASWSDLGALGENTQTYAFAVHEGRLCVGTWPSGRVYRLADSEAQAGATRWDELGRLGEELEVMGLVVHNGKLYGGTLPRAEVYRYDGARRWTRTAQLDTTPDVKYRRAWAMAEHQGRLYCSALPTGHVFALRAGACVSFDRPLPPGWRHVAAVRGGGVLRLYVDGAEVATSEPFDPSRFDLNPDVPLRIGAGAGGSFRGRMGDVRIYRRALVAGEVAALAGR
jgi:outer membrane protein assembly factor BamB